MLTEELLEMISEQNPDAIKLPAEYDDCILGIASSLGNSVLVYDVGDILGVLQECMSFDDALEYFEYNIEGSYLGKYTPIYLWYRKVEK